MAFSPKQYFTEQDTDGQNATAKAAKSYAPSFLKKSRFTVVMTLGEKETEKDVQQLK